MFGPFPQDRLTALGPDIWVVDGPHIRFYGIPFPTRMTVVRLPSGGVWLHSPIAVTDALFAQVAELGEIAHLVSPNWIHYAAIDGWQARVPGAKTWAAPGVKARAEGRVQIRWDADLGAETPADWEGVIAQRLVTGSKAHREVVFHHTSSATLILTDLIENMEPATLPLWLRPLARLGGIVAPRGRMPLDMWLSFRDRPALRGHLEWMLAQDPARVILAHGLCLDGDIQAELRQRFRGVLPASA